MEELNNIRDDTGDLLSSHHGIALPAGGDNGNGASGSTALNDDGLKFTKDVFSNPTLPEADHIFFLDGSHTELDFHYERESQVIPTEVSLVGKTQVTGQFDKYFANATKEEKTRQGASLYIDSAADNVVINLSDTILTDQLTGTEHRYLALIMKWATDNEDATTTSPYFAFVQKGATDQANALQSEIDSYEPGRDGISTGSTGGDDTEKAGGALPSSTSGASETESSKDDGSSKSGGGLAPGAIAGIVVGVVVGLAVIAALVWFLLRRKRKTKSAPHLDSEDGPDTSPAYIADKDSQAQSPQSPYADDHSQIPVLDQNEPRSVSATPAPAIATDRAISTTGDDHPAGDPGHRSVSGTHTPHSVSHHVAHLVEDGMTADDIARLEEEERQLDAEIERAGNH